jgi:hypothetical protein
MARKKAEDDETCSRDSDKRSLTITTKQGRNDHGSRN